MFRHATLQQMRLFEAVARHLNYTRAAEEVHLTQPAVSIQVKRLEEQVGQPLLEMVGKKLYLTPAGELVYASCVDVLDRVRQLDEAINALSGEVAGPLRLAVVSTAKYFMPDYLGEFLRRYPKVVPQLKVTNRERIFERLARNEDDLYVVGTLPELQNGFVAHPFLSHELVVCARPDHPLAGVSGIGLSRLAEERLLMREPGSGIRDAFEQLFSSTGQSCTPYMELGSSESVKQGVMAGIGIGLLSKVSIRLELEVGRLVLLDVEQMPIERHWNLIYPKGKQLSLVTEQFVKFLLSEDDGK